MVEVHLSYPKPADTRDHEAVFQCPIYFDQPACCLGFSEVAMRTALVTRDPEKRAEIESKLDRLLGIDPSLDTFEARLDAAILESFTCEEIPLHDDKTGRRVSRVSLKAVAARMGLPHTALDARLKASGTRYRQRLQAVRVRRFDTLLDADATFMQIADALGYHDHAGFHRAVRKWHGMTPGQYAKRRKAQREV